jgi:hypothetical protein
MKEYRLILYPASNVKGHIKDITFFDAMENRISYVDFNSPMEALKYAVKGVNNATINTQDYILLYETTHFKLIHF